MQASGLGDVRKMFSALRISDEGSKMPVDTEEAPSQSAPLSSVLAHHLESLEKPVDQEVQHALSAEYSVMSILAPASKQLEFSQFSAELVSLEPDCFPSLENKNRDAYPSPDEFLAGFFSDDKISDIMSTYTSAF
jgi:hypothetical protein